MRTVPADETLKVQGAFIYVGIQPNTGWLQGAVTLDPQGFILTDRPDGHLGARDFAAGDVRKKLVRQIATAVGDGATAVLAAEHYLKAYERKYVCFGKKSRSYSVVLLAIALTGPEAAAGFRATLKKEMDRSADSLIQEGMDAYQQKKFARAIEVFQTLKDRYPYSQYAILAELKLADSYYLNKDYELAATSYKDFERLHPANEVIPISYFSRE